MPKWFKKKENIESMEKGTLGLLVLGAIMVLICIATTTADRIGQMIGYDLVNGNMPIDNVGYAWIATVVAYCLGVEGLKILKAKSLEGSEYANGNFKKEELAKMKKALFLTFGMAVIAIVVMVIGAEINCWLFVIAFFVDIIACIIGTATSNGVEMKKLEESFMQDGLNSDDDLNGDSKINFLDLLIAAKQQGMKMTEEQAKELAKKMFGPTGEIVLAPNDKETEEK